MKPEEFQKMQSEIYSALAGAVLSSIPEDWDVANLILGPNKTEDGIESMTHELHNPNIRSGLASAVPNDEVFEHTRRLSQLFEAQNSAWSNAIFSLAWDDDAEGWKFTMNYEYEE